MTATERRARASQLDRDRILRAATEVARREGTSSLTMARVGSEVGARAASLYYHVRSREDLIQGIVDRAGESVVHPPLSERLDVEIENIMLAFYDCLRREAWLVPHLIEGELTSEAVEPLSARADLALRAMGLGKEQAEDAFAAMLHYSYGEVLVVDATVKRGEADGFDFRPLYTATIRRYLRALHLEISEASTA